LLFSFNNIGKSEEYGLVGNSNNRNKVHLNPSSYSPKLVHSRTQNHFGDLVNPFSHTSRFFDKAMNTLPNNMGRNYTKLCMLATSTLREKLDCLKNKMQADDGRDALAKAIYARLFGWIVAKINSNLQENCDITGSVGILDMSGFEDLSQNGFEQLCINAANERLQKFHNDVMFLAEKADYEAEGICVDRVEYRDNQAVIDLLFQKPTGIFNVIDEESTFATSTDTSLVLKLNNFCSASPNFVRSRTESPPSQLDILQETYVQYQVGNMLERNRDRLGSSIIYCVGNSSDDFIRALFTAKRPDTISLGVRKADLKSTNFASHYFQRSLNDLLGKLSEARPWFIRCLKPNSMNVPGKFQSDIVMKQLRQNGVLEMAKIRRDGFAIRMTFLEFCERYSDICFTPGNEVEGTVENCSLILSAAEIRDYALGVHKIFLRHWHGPVLNDLVIRTRRELDNRRAVWTAEQAEIYEVKSMSEQGAFETMYETSSFMGETTSESSNEKVSEWMFKRDYNLSEVGLAAANSTAPPPSVPKSTVRTTYQNSRTELVGVHFFVFQKHSRFWDRFQMIPREPPLTNETFSSLKKLFKIVCYIFLFVIVTICGVVNKLSVLGMTSSIPKGQYYLNTGETPTRTVLIISIVFPYIGWFIMYSTKSFFGRVAWPSIGIIASTFAIELLHTAGLSILVFRLLPIVDMIRGVILMSSIFLIPAFLKTISSLRDNSLSKKKRFVLFILNILAFSVQMCSVVASSTIGLSLDDMRPIASAAEPTSGIGIWEIPVALLLVSMSYWENYVDGDVSLGSITIPVLGWKRGIHAGRQRLYILAAIWKISWTIVFAALLLPGFSINIGSSLILPKNGSNTQQRSDNYVAPISPGNAQKPLNMPLNLSENTDDSVIQSLQQVDEKVKGTSDGSSKKEVDVKNNNFVWTTFALYTPLIIQALASLGLGYFGGLACKVCMQIIGFSLPLCLTPLVTMALVVGHCYSELLPPGPYNWVCPNTATESLRMELLWLAALYISQIVITSHIWFPQTGRMTKIDRLFITPMRCSILTDQSLVLRRRRKDHDPTILCSQEDAILEDTKFCSRKPDDIVPKNLRMRNDVARDKK
ncbi:hypothetical protein ScPMuIL_017478, partial [Solemya velum]